MSARGRALLWAHFFSHFICHGCFSERAYLSRPRTFTEKYVLPLLLLRPVRCADCYQRSWRPLSVAARRRSPALEAITELSHLPKP
jgi:hypothetical protein